MKHVLVLGLFAFSFVHIQSASADPVADNFFLELQRQAPTLGATVEAIHHSFVGQMFRPTRSALTTREIARPDPRLPGSHNFSFELSVTYSVSSQLALVLKISGTAIRSVEMPARNFTAIDKVEILPVQALHGVQR